MKYLIFILFAFAIPLKLMAQTEVKGTVFNDLNKTVPLEKVSVRNLNTRQIALTNSSGQFSIQAKLGDLLEFAFPGYYTDTLFLTNLLPKTIYLPFKASNLKDVEIVGVKVNPYIPRKDPNAKKYTQFDTGYDLDRKKNNDKIGGLGFNLGYGKYRKQERKEAELAENERYEQEINRNFNEESISKLLSLKGQELKDFMGLYRPTVGQVKAERPFNYTYYIVQGYHAWLKLPPSQRRLPPLPSIKAN